MGHHTPVSYTHLTPFKRQLFLAGDVKILGTMADLRFVVTLM